MNLIEFRNKINAHYHHYSLTFQGDPKQCNHVRKKDLSINIKKRTVLFLFMGHMSSWKVYPFPKAIIKKVP